MREVKRGPRWSYRGGLIAGSEPALEALERASLPAADSCDEPAAPEAAGAKASVRAAAPDALENLTPTSRRLLELIGEHEEARTRLEIAVGMERIHSHEVRRLLGRLQRGAANPVEDRLALHRERDALARWTAAAANVRAQLDRIEGEMRALSRGGDDHLPPGGVT